ncbi:MAG: glycosyltransferase family 2 protein [Bacteroidetes bacterium]|nr:glycosyltransferase family 2 protein [Bacteroidota bacterium]
MPQNPGSHPAGISVTIIALNEAANLPRCLASVQGLADEVLVADTGSADETVAIAQAHGAKVLSLPWQGYAATKNTLNTHAQYAYILSLDADEALSPALLEALQALKPHLAGQAVSFPRLTSWCGHWVRHCGWYPDVKVRLFPQDAARWEGAYVHETLQCIHGTRVQHLPHDLLHYSIDSIARHLETVRTYSALQARELAARRKKGLRLKAWVSPSWRFFQMFVLKGGFRDGHAGFVICKLSALAVFLKYTQAIELIRNERAHT